MTASLPHSTPMAKEPGVDEFAVRTWMIHRPIGYTVSVLTVQLLSGPQSRDHVGDLPDVDDFAGLEGARGDPVVRVRGEDQVDVRHPE